MPGQDGELTGDGDLGHVYSLLACDALELMTKRSWVPAGVIGDLDEQPAHVDVALFGDFSLIGPVGALVHARNEAEVTGELQRAVAPSDMKRHVK